MTTEEKRKAALEALEVICEFSFNYRKNLITPQMAQCAIDTIRAALTQNTMDDINLMADRFCQWTLPDGFSPDCGISFESIGSKGTEHEFKRKPVGTNLFSHEQAKEMIRHIINAPKEE